MNRDRLKTLAISDTGFIFDPVTGSAFSSNAVGVHIINCLKAGMSTQEIIASLLELYEVSQEDLEPDVTDFIRGLRDNYLI
jgi:hypothetical protein